MKNQILEQIYWDAFQPGSLSGLEKKNMNISRKELEEWLSTQEAYTRHRRILKKIPRNKEIKRGINDL
jgi:hypothetical protein